MSTLSLPAVQSLLLEDIDWKTYTRLLRAFAERRSLRLTYDCGSLEIMTLTHEHESYAHLLGRFVVVLTEEFGLPIKGGGSTTFRRRKRRKGLEADESYWIANEPLVRGKDRIDLRIAVFAHVQFAGRSRYACGRRGKGKECWSGGVKESCRRY